MRDWPAHKWIGFGMMMVGVLHVFIGLGILIAR